MFQYKDDTADVPFKRLNESIATENGGRAVFIISDPPPRGGGDRKALTTSLA
jgi:hypothetical protein